jgi:predicted RNA-binding Zn-ribbon protein involved in translation (DUF1610 family)
MTDDAKPGPKPLTAEEAAKFLMEHFTQGPLRPKLPEYEGALDFACPSCGEILAERTNKWGISQVPRLDCRRCHLPWRGADLVAIT